MTPTNRVSLAAFAATWMLVVNCPASFAAATAVVDDQPAAVGFSAPVVEPEEAAAPPLPTVEPMLPPPVDNNDYFEESYGDSYEPRFWIKAEYLLWFTRGLEIPALVTTSEPNTTQGNAGVLGLTSTSVLYGNEDIAHKARSGGRLTFGYWFDDYQDYGLIASGFGVSSDQNTGSFFAESTGSPILARPFFNAQSNEEDAELVAFPNILSGQVSVSSSSELQSGALALRRTRYLDYSSRLDCLVGYRFFRYREGLSIEENLVSTNPGGLIQQGTTLDLVDRFNTHNDFHGGELGFIYEADHGPWTFEVVTKVALGAMFEKVEINGRTVVTTPGDPSVTTAGGLLALPTNIGAYTRDEFCVVPELNVNLHYWLTERLNMTFGYTGIYVSEVVRAADQIDRNVDPRQLPGFGQPSNPSGVTSPAALFRTTDFWVQGANFGLEYVW